MLTRTYTVLFDADPEAGGYTVTVPALPGVVTQGDTVQQCLERVQEVIALHLAAMADDGEPIPEEQVKPLVLTGRSASTCSSSWPRWPRSSIGVVAGPPHTRGRWPGCTRPQR